MSSSAVHFLYLQEQEHCQYDCRCDTWWHVLISVRYGGATIDRQIIECSNLMTKVDPGDSLMADNCFDVQDTFAPVDVTVNIPT